MKDVLRLLLIAALSFVIVGAAIAYTRGGDVLDRLLTAVSVDSLSRLAPSDTPPATGLNRVWVPRPHQERWMGLAGFPDSSEIRFPLPIGINAASATLRLAFDAELSADGDGRMTIAVNGDRRGEIVLNAGRSRHEVEIALDASDMLGHVVVVTLEGRGTTSGGQICPVDATNSGAAITLLAESGLEVLTADATDTLPVRIATLADPARLDRGVSPDEQALAIWGRQVLERNGVAVRWASEDHAADIVIVEDGAEAGLALDAASRIVVSGRSGLHTLLRTRGIAPVAQAIETWPISVETLGAETLLKTFRGSRRWAIPYALADLPGGLTPRTFRLAIKPSKLAANTDWMVRVSLNENLLTTERFEGQSDTLALDISLPIGIQTLANVLQVELIDTSTTSSVCQVLPSAQAQLLGQSSLTLAGTQPRDGLPLLVREMANAGTLGLTVAAPLDAGAQRVAAAMLGKLLPASAEVRFGADAEDAPITIAVTTASGLRAALRDIGEIGADFNMRLVIANAEDGSDPGLVGLFDALPMVQDLAGDTVILMVTR